MNKSILDVNEKSACTGRGVDVSQTPSQQKLWFPNENYLLATCTSQKHDQVGLVQGGEQSRGKVFAVQDGTANKNVVGAADGCQRTRWSRMVANDSCCQTYQSFCLISYFVSFYQNLNICSHLYVLGVTLNLLSSEVLGLASIPFIYKITMVSKKKIIIIDALTLYIYQSRGTISTRHSCSKQISAAIWLENQQ